MAIRGIGVQTKEAIDDACPEDGVRILKEAGFSHVDFSLNKYMINKDILTRKAPPLRSRLSVMQIWPRAPWSWQQLKFWPNPARPCLVNPTKTVAMY